MVRGVIALAIVVKKPYMWGHCSVLEHWKESTTHQIISWSICARISRRAWLSPIYLVIWANYLFLLTTTLKVCLRWKGNCPHMLRLELWDWNEDFPSDTLNWVIVVVVVLLNNCWGRRGKVVWGSDKYSPLLHVFGVEVQGYMFSCVLERFSRRNL
jgi:hypothetical protein